MTKTPNCKTDQSDKNYTLEVEQIAQLSTGKAAILLNQPAHTLRTLDKEGFLKLDSLSSGGHRRYSMSQLQPFIKHFKENESKDSENYDLPNSQLINFDNSIILTSADYQSVELLPSKSQSKLMHAMIASSSEKTALLSIFLGLLITVLINLILQISARSSMLMVAHQLQDEYLQFQNEHHQFSPQGIEMAKLKPSQKPGKKNKSGKMQLKMHQKYF